MAAHDDHRVIIKNLAFNLANSKGMSGLFQSHGFQGVRPEKVYINRKGMISNTPGQMCVAFVTLSNEKEVEAAIKTFHGKTLQGLSDKPVSVQRAVPRLSTLRSSSSTAGTGSHQAFLGGDADLATSQQGESRWSVEEIYTDPTSWKRARKAEKRARRLEKDVYPDVDPEPQEETPWARRQSLRATNVEQHVD